MDRSDLKQVMAEHGEAIWTVIQMVFPDATEIEGGWTLKTVGDRRIDLLHMMFNVRVVDSHVNDVFSYDRYWCYPKEATVIALAAVAAWDAAADTEPTGWVKSWDQRRHGEGPVKPRAVA